MNTDQKFLDSWGTSIFSGRVMVLSHEEWATNAWKQARDQERRWLHQLVTLQCAECKQQWVKDQWLGKGGMVDEALEEAEHCLTGCKGSVSIIKTHSHTLNCKCFIPERK